MKKRTIACLLALCALLPLGAQARQHVNIQQLHAQAAQGWMRQYQSHGRALTVDVVPLVPQVDKVPLLEVSRRVAQVTLPKAEPLWAVSRSDQYDFMLQHGVSAGEEPAGSILLDGKRISAKPYQMLYQRHYADDSTLIPGNPLTFGEVRALMAQGLQMASIPADAIDLSAPEQVMTFGYYDESPRVFHAPGWASFTWNARLQGIPVLTPFSVPFKQGSDEPTMLYPRLGMTIRRADLFHMGGTALH